jgi:hypothetical protein
MNGLEFLPSLSFDGRRNVEDAVRQLDGTGQVILRVTQLPSNARLPNQGHIIKVGYKTVGDKPRQVWLQVSRVFGMDGGAHAEIERRLDGMRKFFEANGLTVNVQRSFNPSLRDIPPVETKPVMYKGSQALKDWADLHGETQSDFDPEPRE